MHREAQRDAGRAREQTDETELERVGDRDRALRLAEHAQHRAVVQVPVGEVARRDADRHRGQQRSEQRDEVQELLGAVERLAHFGAARFERLDTHAAQLRVLDALVDMIDVLAHRRIAGGLPAPLPSDDATARR